MPRLKAAGGGAIEAVGGVSEQEAKPFGHLAGAKASLCPAAEDGAGDEIPQLG